MLRIPSLFAITAENDPEFSVMHCLTDWCRLNPLGVINPPDGKISLLLNRLAPPSFPRWKERFNCNKNKIQSTYFSPGPNGKHACFCTNAPDFSPCEKKNKTWLSFNERHRKVPHDALGHSPPEVTSCLAWGFPGRIYNDESPENHSAGHTVYNL